MAEAPAGVRAAMSLDDYNFIERLMRERGWAALSFPEKWRWHAYTRAWRKLHYLGGNPLDPKGEWWDRRLDEPAEVIVKLHMKEVRAR